MWTPARQFMLLLACAAAVYFVGNASAPLWDRDEPRYAQCSRQMLQSGDWVVPRLYDEPRAVKPPLIYWCQATAMAAIDASPLSRMLAYPEVFAARLPSSAAMLVTIVVLWIGLRKLSDDDTVSGPGSSGAPVSHVTTLSSETRALWTVFIFASSLLTIACAKVCLTDSVQLVLITAAQFCVYAIWRGRGSSLTAILLAVILGLGGLTKGPFILGIVGCTIAALTLFRFLDRRFPGAAIPATYRTKRSTLIAMSVVALVVVIAMALPWLIMVEHRQPGFLRRILTEFGKHVKKGGEGHGFPPGYHLLVIWATYLPWSLFLPLAIVAGWKNRRVPAVRFALAAVAGPWVMLELLGTKLPHYALACFPAIAFLTADVLLRSLASDDTRSARGELRSKETVVSIGIWAGIIAGLGVGGTGVLVWLHRKHVPALPWISGGILAALAVVYGGLVFNAFHTRRPVVGLLTMGCGSALLTIAMFTLFVPNARFLHLSPRAGAVLIANHATRPHEELMTDYKEPSLAFYQGGTLREAPDAYKSRLISKGHVDLWTPWMVTTGDVWNRSPAWVQNRLHVVWRERGLAISDGMRVLDLMIVRPVDGSAATTTTSPHSVAH